ncbi:MAG: transketolase [Verrucomicrobia bacterium]|nr:MAG: transketolase [Verrucomicrobiota bacterium]
MRNAWIRHLQGLAERDERIFLVVGDLGFSVVEDFAAAYPERFLNAGVAEQNMVSVAAGLAREGYSVFVYSIGNFVTLRCLEQIRNDVCLHRLPVCLVAVGGGFMYGALGPTHHLTEDIAVMRAMPGMRVYVPFCARSAEVALDEVLSEALPAYIRLGREGVPVGEVAGNGVTAVRRVASGVAGTAVLNVGALHAQVVEFAEKNRADLYALCRLKPLPAEELEEVLGSYRRIVVVEDHQRWGGAYGAVCEAFGGSGRVESVAVEGFVLEGGREEDLRRRFLRGAGRA